MKFCRYTTAYDDLTFVNTFANSRIADDDFKYTTEALLQNLNVRPGQLIYLYKFDFVTMVTNSPLRSRICSSGCFRKDYTTLY